MSTIRKVEFGIFADVPPDSGWHRILEQEMPPYRMVDGPDAPVILFEQSTPEWTESYLSRGGVAILMAADVHRNPWLEGDRGGGVVTRARFADLGMDTIQMPCCMDLFSAEGWGEIKIHEKRFTKNGLRNGRFPLVCHQRVGKGHCLFSGAPLTRLLTVLGDTLREFSGFSPITERVSAVDKCKISRVLVWTMQKAAQLAEMPYAHLWYYPEGASSIFGFRVDVDGVFPPNLDAITESAAAVDIPLSIFVNKSMCQDDLPSLKRIHPMHEIGNHATVHNLFDDETSNVKNIQECKDWLDSQSLPSGPWFVAPRGMWNMTLGTALEALGYDYSSDFGLDFDGLPFFPRFRGRRLKLLQVPIHPWSVERAFKFSEETGSPRPEAAQVLEYYKCIGLEQIRANQPALFYSHPQHFGPMAAKVLPELKRSLMESGASMTTLARYSTWWKMRDNVRFEIEQDAASSTLALLGDIPSGLSVNVVSRAPIHFRSGQMESRTLINRNRLSR